jgi:tetratricopeptide (TPR) repeat protein
MNRAQWQKVESIFQGALDRPDAQRAAYLREACGSDNTLRAEVDAMLQQHATDPEFLEQPLVKLDTGGFGVSQRIGPYRIVREVGVGGMGIVYLAMHEGPGFERPVALKVIRRGLDTDDVLRRFQLERRILAGLKHPNVANLVDAGQTDDGRPYFVMDFVEGVPIDVFCDRENLSITRRLQLYQMVCDAVQHAHNNLVLHRDIKPGNILVSAGGIPILLDFGIAKLVDPMEPTVDSGPTTRTGMRAFTPDYAAPEQLRGAPVSTATDVYGLGLLLYRLLTNKRPFEPHSGFAYEKAVLETEPPRPSSFGNRALAGDLDTIVLKALRKEPERRYTSVSALAEDVQRHLDGLPVRARADTFAYRASKFARRNRVALAAGTVVFASLVAATLYSRAQTREVTRERDKALEVQNFLLETFGSRGGGDTVAVRSVLDAQAALVPIAYADRPELRAQMQHVLAESYDRLAQLASAEQLAREALALRRTTLAPDHPDIAASLDLLGWIQHERGKSDSGEALLRESVRRWENARPQNPLLYSRALNDLGAVREARGGYDEADTLYRRALSIRRALPGQNDRAIATTTSNLSIVLFRKGDIKGAVAQAETSLTLMRRAMGPDHQRTTLIQGNLASMRVQQGDVAGAIGEFRDVLTRQTRVLGRDHGVTSGTMYALGSALRTQGKLAESDTMLTETLAVQERVLGAEHPRVGQTLALLGSVRASMKRFAEARPLLERAVAIQRKARGETHRETVATRLRLAQTLVALNRRSDADAVLRLLPDSGLSAGQRALRDSLRATR